MAADERRSWAGSVQSAELSAWDLEASRRGRTKCQSQKGGLSREKPTPKSIAAH